MQYATVCTSHGNTVPTALDRIQVLLRPDEYAEVCMLASEERRSLASMAAVLIAEAIKQRIKEGTFVPNEDDPSYANAKRRQVARAIGQKVDKEGGVLDGVNLPPDIKKDLVAKKVSSLSMKETVESLQLVKE